MPDARVRQHGEKSYLQETLLIWICQNCNDSEMHRVARAILFRCGNDFPIGFPFNEFVVSAYSLSMCGATTY